KKAFPGAAPAFDGTDSDGDGTDADKPGSKLGDTGKEPKVKPGSSKKGAKATEEREEPEVEKTGAKACPNCGKNYHADSKQKTCEHCGTKLPKANKAAEVASEKAAKAKNMCPGCGANIHAKHAFCPECGGSMAKAKPIKKALSKNHDFTCLGCEKQLDKGEKFWPGCGKQNPGYLPMADNKVKGAEGGTVEKGKPTPDGDAVGVGAVDIQPVPSHREPDGPFIESLEHDAQLPTDPDGPYLMEMKAARRIKDAGAPYELGALHDLLCAGFHP